MKGGDVLDGKYRLVRPIGKGGMGTVWEARHAVLGRPVAVKFLRVDVADDRDVIERFMREARSAAAIAHPRIVDVFDVGWTEDGDVPWFAMELLEGGNLAAALREAGCLPVARAVWITCQVLDALEAAHARGIIHRDLKPENVFLVPHGIEDDVKVLDFGVSKMMDARMTVTGVVLGTPAYMSPEQARGSSEVDHRADLYAAGAILFEMLAGRPPFEGQGYREVLFQILEGSPPSLATLRPGLHPRILEVVDRALARDPADRWATAAAMRSALSEVAEGIEAMAGRPNEWSASSLTKTRHYDPADSTGAAAEAEEEDADDEPTAKTDEPSRPVPLYSGPGSGAASTPTVRRRPRSRVLPLLFVLAATIGAGIWVGLLAAGRDCRTRVTIATPGARAWLDGLPFGAEIDLPGSCGDRHRLHVEAPGFAPRDLVVEASESPGTRVELAPSAR